MREQGLRLYDQALESGVLEKCGGNCSTAIAGQGPPSLNQVVTDDTTDILGIRRLGSQAVGSLHNVERDADSRLVSGAFQQASVPRLNVRVGRPFNVHFEPPIQRHSCGYIGHAKVLSRQIVAALEALIE